MQLGVLRSDAEGFVGMPCIHDAFDIPLWSLWDLMGIWGPSVCSGSGDLLGCLCFDLIHGLTGFHTPHDACLSPGFIGQVVIGSLGGIRIG